MTRGTTMHDTPSISTQMGEALLVRMTRLEKESRLAKRINVILGGAVVIAFGLAAIAANAAGAFNADPVVDATAFVLRDENGIARGAWELTEQGGSRIVMRDQDGAERMRVSVLEDGAPGLALIDRHGRARIVLSLQADEMMTLSFADEQGGTRAVLGLAPDHSASLVFLDGLGQARGAFGLDTTGEPTFAVIEGEGAETAPGNDPSDIPPSR